MEYCPSRKKSVVADVVKSWCGGTTGLVFWEYRNHYCPSCNKCLKMEQINLHKG